MGNICGKQDALDTQPGRRLGSPPRPKKTSAVPRKVGGPPRTLGGGAGNSAGPEDARARAGEAAQARNAASRGGGKLQRQLSAQKKQSRSDTLKQASVQEQRARDADAAAQARNWD